MARGLGSVAGRVAVVTGAASGIGRATAALLAERGARLGLLDIDAVKLAAFGGELRGRGEVVSHVTDVANAEAVGRAAALMVRELGGVDLVVNSAGVAVIGDFSATSAEDWDFVFDVNVKGTANVCRAFLPALAKRGGQIVNVASAAAFATPGGLAAYGASKHALVGFSQALRDELGAQGIGVSLVCPGFVDTPIGARARLPGHADAAAERLRIADFLRARGLTAERVAHRIVQAAERDEPIVTIGAEAHVLRALARVLPERVPSLFSAVRRLSARFGGAR